jgi:predicted nucleic acid-binding protein
VVFFDTNVLIYAARPELESRDEYKRPIAIELLASEEYAVSGQVLAEFYHNTVRKGDSRLSHQQAMGWIERLAGRPFVAVDAAIVSAGAAFSERYKIGYWDGAMLAAAEALGADLFYSEDLNHGQRYGNVTAINPFLPTSH